LLARSTSDHARVVEIGNAPELAVHVHAAAVMSYQVRLADVDDVRAALLPLWAESLPVEGELEAKLRWFYREGPHGVGNTFVVQPEGGQAPDVQSSIIGSAGIGARTLRYRERRLRAALFADLAIERAHRSGFPALALVRAVKGHTCEHFDLGYGFPNAKAAAVYRRVGYLELGAMRRYVRVLRPGPFLERRFGESGPVRAIATLADHAVATADRLRALPVRGFELTWLETFDERFDRLWREGLWLAPIACERTASFLTWRFGRQPGRRYWVAALVDRASRHLRAYAVVRTSGPVAEIADLFGVGVTELDILMRALLPALHELGFQSATMRFFGIPELPVLLGRHGFMVRPETRMIALAYGPKLDIPGIEDPASWFVTDLDEDS
jgi:hypothetical protein